MNRQLDLPLLGLERKRAAHSHFEQVARDWLARARAYARLQCEVWGSVTSDDVRDTIGDPPEGISHNAIGAIFMDGSFKPIGRMHSKRPSSNGRSIIRWALR